MWAHKIIFLLICVAFAQAINIYPPPKEATLTERPFQAAIFKNGKYHCGGALISSHCVLTACSCVEGEVVELGESKQLSVNYTLITHTSSLWEGEIYWTQASDLYTVNGCNTQTNENDAAILCSTETLPGSPENIVDEPTRVNVRGIVSGWGISVDGEDDIQANLQRAYMRIIGLEECRLRYRGIRDVPDSTLCAIATQEVHGFCAGDIGGPLTHGAGIIGIAVNSFGCERMNLPGIFTNVSRIGRSLLEVVKNFDLNVANEIV